MKLSAPKTGTFILAFVLGVLGIVAHFVKIPFVSANDYWFVVAGYALLLLGSFFKGL